MKAPDYWGIMGFPVSHSLTPQIFQIVGDYVGFKDVETIFIEARNLEEVIKKTSEIKGNFWLSVTSPLKHQLHKEFSLEYVQEVGGINQITNFEGEWKGINTDGLGFIEAVKYTGMEIKNSILKMKGGGSTARSIAHQWAKCGGKLIIDEGRREIGIGTWNNSITDNSNPDISINFDILPGIVNNDDFVAEKYTMISYNENYNNDDFAIIMLVAQHLEAWKILFDDEFKEKLPSIEQILSKL